ncbi:MAG: phosphate acyltransferase PlsX [candidate division WOR-3 bacterium]|nr:phosphate acyltransferase PlsX [candidate division WOR-3 bacterium]MCX7947489.1 phosphate acyltransferase PlsX [candidate division WOR-3 bacterium]MDW8150648.1 phosphate acyltransferase PlsX [candidate division WOR-3 bacterium]
MIFKVAVDAMGSDNAPIPEIKGSIEYLKNNKNVEIYLVGQKDLLESEIKRMYSNTKVENLHIVDAKEVVKTNEKPSDALKYKKDSSISVGLNLHKEGIVNSFISAGHTGAIMAFSIFTIGRIQNVKRPAIGALFPTTEGNNLVLDVGANVDISPQVLFQFGILGSVFYSILFNNPRPKVGILSIGEEEVKGNQVVIDARKLFESSDLNFIGFVEGHEILSNKADVIVMDGFVGNTLLKFGESVFFSLVNMIKNEVKKNFLYLLGAYFMKGAFENVKKHADFEEYGGAPLLGVNGNVIICHGRSSHRAIYNAINVSRKLYENRLTEKILEKLSKYKFS